MKNSSPPPTVGQLSVNCRSTVGQLLVKCWLTGYRQPTDSLPTAYRQPTDSLPTAYRQPTDSLPTAYRQPTDSLPTAYRQPTDGFPKHTFFSKMVQETRHRNTVCIVIHHLLTDRRSLHLYPLVSHCASILRIISRVISARTLKKMAALSSCPELDRGKSPFSRKRVW